MIMNREDFNIHSICSSVVLDYQVDFYFDMFVIVDGIMMSTITLLRISLSIYHENFPVW